MGSSMGEAVNHRADPLADFGWLAALEDNDSTPAHMARRQESWIDDGLSYLGGNIPPLRSIRAEQGSWSNHNPSEPDENTPPPVGDEPVEPEQQPSINDILFDIDETLQSAAKNGAAAWPESWIKDGAEDADGNTQSPFVFGSPPTPPESKIDELLFDIDGTLQSAVKNGADQAGPLDKQGGPFTQEVWAAKKADLTGKNTLLYQALGGRDISSLRNTDPTQNIQNPPESDSKDALWKRVGRDIFWGLINAPFATYKGARNTAQATLDFASGGVNWLYDKTLYDWSGTRAEPGVVFRPYNIAEPITLRELRDSVISPEREKWLKEQGITLPEMPDETVTGDIIEGLAEFATGLLLPGGIAVKLIKLGSVVVKGAQLLGKAMPLIGRKADYISKIVTHAVAGAINDTIVFNPNEPGLADNLKDLGYNNDLIEYLATDPDDGDLEKRFKRILEGTLLGTVFNLRPPVHGITTVGIKVAADQSRKTDGGETGEKPAPTRNGGKGASQ